MSLTTSLAVAPYQQQREIWPSRGRHIMAQFDDDSIIVYQAYQAAIGDYVIEHGAFGGPNFGFGRMSWIKPNFLWMMFRSGWGTKDNQEVTLGLRLSRDFFDGLLKTAVASSHGQSSVENKEAWQAQVRRSNVRLQWDPDHDPYGGKIERRAIQLGLRGKVLEAFAGPELLEVIDMREFVAEQREHIMDQRLDRLQTPQERPYVPEDPAAAAAVGLCAMVST